ncbi:MAG: nitrite reductase small subunit NirD [Actinomycetes bacterium]
MTALLAPSALLAVCRLDDLVPERGAAVVVDGRQVALFLLHDGSVRALSNRDPFSGAYVLSRGIVGDRSGRPVVVSPVYKQAFDLETGQCLDSPDVRVPAYDIVVEADVVHVTRSVLPALRR